MTNSAAVAWLAWEREADLRRVLQEFSLARGLTWAKNGPRTLLMWPQPDIVSLAERIASGETIRLANAPLAPTSPAASEDELERSLADYVATLDGWKDRTPGWKRDLPQQTRRHHALFALEPQDVKQQDRA